MLIVLDIRRKKSKRKQKQLITGSLAGRNIVAARANSPSQRNVYLILVYNPVAFWGFVMTKKNKSKV